MPAHLLLDVLGVRVLSRFLGETGQKRTLLSVALGSQGHGREQGDSYGPLFSPLASSQTLGKSSLLKMGLVWVRCFWGPLLRLVLVITQLCLYQTQFL